MLFLLLAVGSLLTPLSLTGPGGVLRVGALPAPRSDGSTATVAVRGPVAADEALEAAAASLAQGGGPAGGAPMSCGPSGGGMRCSGASPSTPSVSFPSGSSPTSRYGVGLAPYGYGAESTVVGVLLFGGASSSGAVDSDTWQYDQSTQVWTNITGALGCGTPGACPSARHDAAMVWDPGDGVVVLFGGCGSPTEGWTESTPGCYGSGSLLSDTWEYSASIANPSGTWTKLNPTTGPSARFAAGVTYDGGIGSVLLYGGCGSVCPLADTWEFSAGRWTPQSPATSPPALYGEALGYVPGLPTPGAVLFGGCGDVEPGCGASGPDQSTWEFTASPTVTWTELIAATGCGGPTLCPPAEFLGGYTTYGGPGLGAPALVLNGGVGPDGAVYGNATVAGGDWWAFGDSGAVWTQYTAPPGDECPGPQSNRTCVEAWYGPEPPAPLLPRYSEGMVGINSGGDDLVLFGGSSSSGSSLGDTWQGSEGPVWAPSLPSPRYGATVTYDNSTRSSVLFGGCTYGCPNAETWQFEKKGSTSTAWVSGNPPLTEANSPGARMNASMAYDPTLGGVILFGGRATDGSLLNDTWNFTSAGTWELLPVDEAGSKGSTEPPMQSTSMVWDPVGKTSTNSVGTLLLYGGLSASGPQDTLYGLAPPTPMTPPTYTYNWTFINSSQQSCLPGPICTRYSPPPLYGASMVYDPSYRQVVLFGGCGSGCPLDGMYALNGNYQWNDCVNCGSQPFPSARWGASMAYDPADGYVLLFGGMGATGPLGDTWSFTLGPEPPCTVLIVARAFCAYLTEHNGTEQPSGRWGAAMDFDPNLGGILLFGGWAVTEGAISNEYGWEYSGGLWTTMTYPGLLSQYGAPPPAFGERLAYDSANGFVVEYGGCAPAVASGAVASCGPMADGYGVTWEYANGAWTALPPAAGSPGARWDEGLAYDAASNEVILFGGCRATDAICSGNASLLLGDTWSLTLGLLGTGSWSRVSSGGVGSPSPRGDLSMGYDSSDGVVVMFGGYGCSGGPGQVCGDTWTYGSGGWSPQSPSVKPVPRFGAEFAYDPETRGMVLVGGSTGGGLLSDVWSYNLTSGWVGEPAAPSPGYDGGVAFDPVLGGLVVFGGVGAGGTPTAQTAILGTFGGSSLRWVAAPTIITPTARWGMGMVDDASAGPMGYVVMVGGSVADNSSEPGPGGWSGAWGETWDFYGYLPLGGVEPQEPEYWLNLSEVT